MTPRLDIITRPIFIFAVGLLLCNDLYLKYEFSGFLTGKLSDIAGLFAFPFFFSAIWPRHSNTIYIVTAILFAFWKSQFSQPIIDILRTTGIGVNRTIDYTDLLALLIMPLSYCYFEIQKALTISTLRVLKIAVVPTCLFAFYATTIPREKIDVNTSINKSYELPMTKSELFALLKPAHAYSDSLEKNLGDSVFYLHFDIEDDYRVMVTALSTITETKPGFSTVRLDSVIYGYVDGQLLFGIDAEDITNFRTTTAEEFASIFESTFIEPVRTRKAENLYFDNKEIEDAVELRNYR